MAARRPLVNVSGTVQELPSGDTLVGGITGGSSVATVGNGSATDITVTHNLGTRDVDVIVRDAASPYAFHLVPWDATDTNNVTLHFDTAPATNSRRVVVLSSGGTAGSSLPNPALMASGYSLPGAVLLAGSTMAWGNNNLKVEPFYVPVTITLTGMQVRVTTAGTASSVARLGVYASDRNWSGGGALVLDAGTVAVDSTGVKNLTGLSQSLTPGWYWAVLLNNAASAPEFVYYLVHPAGVGGGTVWRGHDPTASGLSYQNGTQTYGALPSTLPSTSPTYSTENGHRSFIFLSWT